MTNYQLPTLPVEALPTPQVTQEELDKKQTIIIRVFDSYGISVNKITLDAGPSVSRWTLEVNRDDFDGVSRSRNQIMASINIHGTRLVNDHQQKTVAIEIPNNRQVPVSIGAILSSREYQESEMELPCALGLTVDGKPFLFDLTKLPHLIIGGDPDQGKSRVIHAMLASLLCKKRPDELKVVMIDTRRLEFLMYNDLAGSFLATTHLTEHRVIIDTDEAAYAIKGLHHLMEIRYQLLKRAGVHCIKDYNDKIAKGLLSSTEGYSPMPYIVLFVDEFKDLMLTKGKEIETPLVMMAQKSRAVGIHLVISTHLLSPGVLTGIIKGNFPGRVAVRTQDGFASQIILDCEGAEHLADMGDLLFRDGDGSLIRIQSAHAGENNHQVRDICYQIHRQCPKTDLMLLPPPMDVPNVRSNMNWNGADGFVFEYTEPLFEDAARFVVHCQMAYTSMLQRYYSIGYNRANRLLSMLERAGIVSLVTKSGARDVLVKDNSSLQSLLNSLKNK